MPRKPGIYGPYPHGKRYRLVIVDAGGETSAQPFETEQEADAAKRRLKGALGLVSGPTIGASIDDYEIYLRDVKRNKPKSYDATIWRLGVFFGDTSEQLAAITPKGAAACYTKLTTALDDDDEPRYAVDSHRNMLAEARTFLNWCVSKGWIKSNPLDGTKGEGKRMYHNKPQLGIDEARKWLAKAIELAKKGDTGAVAGMTALLLGLRASEIISREVRDLDDGGRLLRVPQSKTLAGRRLLEVPEVLQPFMVALTKDKLPTAPLFESRGDPSGKAVGVTWHTRGWVLKSIKRVCKNAGVPIVCSHSMRGLHSTLAIAAGQVGPVVAAQLGHSKEAVTFGSYIDPETAAATTHRRTMTVLTGGANEGKK